VQLYDGSTIPIQDLKPGDVMLSYDLINHRFYPNIVESVVNYTVRGEYVINGNVGTDAAELFYTKNGWTAAQNLTIGESVLNPLSGSWIPIKSIDYYNVTLREYDILGSYSNNWMVDGGYLSDPVSQ